MAHEHSRAGGRSAVPVRIRVQNAVTNNTIGFRLDDRHLAVHTNL